MIYERCSTVFLLGALCVLLALSGDRCLAADSVEFSADPGSQEYRRIHIDVKLERNRKVSRYEIWFSDKPFNSTDKAQLHSFVRVDKTSSLVRVPQGKAYDDCWSGGQPIHRDAAGIPVIDHAVTRWSCNLAGMTPGANQWIAVIPVDESGSALIDTARLTPVVARTDAGDERTAPPDTRPIAFALSSIVFLAVLLLFYLRRRDVRRGRTGSRLAHAYIAPALLALAILSFYPVLYGIWLAFTNADQSHLGDESWIGLANFLAVFASTGMWRVTFFTAVWAVSNVLAQVILGLGLALALNRSGLRGKTVYRTVLLLPWAIPAYISVLAWRGILQTEGLLNAILGTHLDFLADVTAARVLVILVNIWLGVPFMMMTLSGALQALREDIFEAADVDGVSRWNQFVHLTLPNLKSTLVPISLLAFIFTFNNFATIYLLTRGDPVVGFGEPGATDILVTYVFKIAFEFGHYGVAAAWSVIIFLMLVGFSWIYMKASRATEAVG
jgi:arabinogalactan oligomer/maltooligosaccharide transport system permease protein